MARQWKIIQALLTSKQGKTVGELHQLLDLTCDKRSVYRDIQDLEAGGFPLCCDMDNGAQCWSVIKNARTPLPMLFNVEELIALYLSRDMMADLKGTSIYKDLDSLFSKIKAGIHESFHEYLDQSGPLPVLSFKHSAGQLDKKTEERVNRLEKAIQNKHFVDMTYFTQSRKSETERRVAPYTLWVSEGDLYLIGRCELRQEVRIFSVKRIRKLVVTDKIYTIPEEFSLAQFMKASFNIYQGPETRVILRFDKEVTDCIKEKVWHASQVIRDSGDGSIEFEVTVAGTEEIKRWILGWGESATVLEPDSLRQDILSCITKMAKAYQPVPPPLRLPRRIEGT